MENFLFLLLLGGSFLAFFSLSVIVGGILKIEKHLRTISEDLKIISLLKNKM